MEYFVSNSSFGAGHLYTKSKTHSHKVKYVLTGEEFATPTSAQAFAPLFFKWVLESKNSSLYLQTYPNHSNLFTSSFFSNYFAKNYVSFEMTASFKYIASLKESDSKMVYNSLLDFISQSFIGSEYKDKLRNLVSFTWMMIYEVYKPPKKDDSNWSDDTSPEWCRTDDDTPWENYLIHPKHKPKEKGTTTMSNQILYKHVDAAGVEHFCHYLATDSTGRWVVEVKGTGTVMSVDKATVEEVTPFTFTVRWARDDSTNNYSFKGDVKLLKEGMVFANKNGHIGTITKLNSKSKCASDIDADSMFVIPTMKLSDLAVEVASAPVASK